MGSLIHNAYTSTIGVSLVLYTSYKLFDAARLYTRPSHLHRYLSFDAITGQQHAWALITGATSGIGKNLAQELAGHGFNIILHGRNATKLAAMRAELLQSINPATVEMRVLVADASQCQSVDFARIRDELVGLHLTILVNCAGAGPIPAFGALEDYGADAILESLHLNAAFPALLTSALLPVLKGRYRRTSGEKSEAEGNSLDDEDIVRAGDEGRRGIRGRAAEKGKRTVAALIINIGSVTDDGFPLVSFYSAGKAAGHALHKAIAREAALDRQDGCDVEIEVISHRVGAVTGVSHTSAPATLFRPDARTIARAILARTGCGQKSVVPYWPHAAQQAFLGAVPVFVRDSVLNSAMREEKRAQDEEAKRE